MKKRREWHLFLLLGSASLLASSIMACQPVPPSLAQPLPPPSPSAPAPQSPPVIADFSADRTEITSGWSVTLSWRVIGATKANIDQGIGEVALGGAVAVNPATTTAYTLVAINAAGTVRKSLTITVAPLPSSPPPSSPPTPPVPPPPCPSCR